MCFILNKILNKISLIYIIIFISNNCVNCRSVSPNVNKDYDRTMHPTSFPSDLNIHRASGPSSEYRNKRAATFTMENEKPEQCPLFWQSEAQFQLKEQLEKKLNRNYAKNVIMFLGDGMSLSTVAAARMLFGQRNGDNGEESKLSFEEFPFIGLSKTYCVDKQVADSACSATAYLCGVKGNYGTIGVSGKVQLNHCNASSDPTNHVQSILQWGQVAGKGTGIVTTTRVTHASPAGTYSHVGNREWESDANVLEFQQKPKECQDIASQLIYNAPGRNFNVILGGGRQKFLPKDGTDENGEFGERLDKKNLINEWRKQKGNKGQYVYDRNGLKNLSYDKTEYLLGLFESSHMTYNLDADRKKEPSLSEMTEAAIKMLAKHSNGYILFIEGGRIDHAHHSNLARKALDETIEFSEAVRTATELVDITETLIVVTADHAHTMSISGYSKRGADILGLNTLQSTIDNLPYSTLSYANGIGFKGDKNGNRLLLTENQLKDKNFEYPSLVPLVSETHGGDDVGVYAIGPWAHLFVGVYEQNTIPHLMGFAACVGKGLTACELMEF